MASTTTTPSGFLSSPRGQQWLLWGSGAVLVIGIAVFLGIFLSRGNSTPVAAGTNPNVSTVHSREGSSTGLSTKPKKNEVKASPVALQTARTFLETAVVRKNVDAAYNLVGPYLKGGITRAQWDTGNIPPTFYPAANASTARFYINTSQPKQLIIEVVLKARPGQKPGGKSFQAFKIGMNLVGKKWLVTTFFPEFKQPIQVNPNN